MFSPLVYFQTAGLLEEIALHGIRLFKRPPRTSALRFLHNQSFLRPSIRVSKGPIISKVVDQTSLACLEKR